MKLYAPPEPPTLMRINIKKQGHITEHVAIEEADQQELLEWLKALIDKQGLSIFAYGRATTVEVRESVHGKNGKTISFSFKGLDPHVIKELILKNLKREGEK